MHDRYADLDKFITDPDKLQITNRSEVSISSEENYDIVIDLQGRTAEFEQLKPFMILIAQNICRLDHMAQWFDALHSGSSQFPYVIAVIFMDGFDVTLRYWGTEENTEFDVVFSYSEGEFTLKSFGTILNVPPDWEQSLSAGRNKKEQSKRKRFGWWTRGRR